MNRTEAHALHRVFRACAAGLALFVLLAPAATAQRDGSIYDPEQGPQGLTANKTARRVGDLLTVVISEQQDLSNQEKTDLQRSTDLRYRLTNFDVKPNAFNVLPQVAADSADNFAGTANYQKTGRFQARLTAVVADTLPNGNLVVRGRREIRIDQEVKVLEFSGIVRRYDILPDNTVTSELVADAQVSYAGTGPLTNSTNRRGIGGWLHSLFSWLWPF